MQVAAPPHICTVAMNQTTLAPQPKLFDPLFGRISPLVSIEKYALALAHRDDGCHELLNMAVTANKPTNIAAPPATYRHAPAILH